MNQRKEKYARLCERNGFSGDSLRWKRRAFEAEDAARKWRRCTWLAVTALAVSMVVGLTILARAMPVAAELDKPAGAAVQTIPEASEAPDEAALYESGYFRSDVPLDGDTQALLRSACEESGVPYELALAVIWKETGYRNVVGDDGESVGYMQIQEKWHEGRMARLGVADLSDPCGNFRVGCDYLAELLEKYGLPDALTAYNRGAPGKSDYAKAVIGYLGDLEGEELQ